MRGGERDGRFICTCWNLWKNRNAKVFGDGAEPAGVLVQGDTRGTIMEYRLLDKMMFCKLHNLITVVFLSLGHSG